MALPPPVWLTEAGRAIVTKSLRRCVRWLAGRRIDTVLAWNRDTARQFEGHGSVIIQPALALPGAHVERARGPREGRMSGGVAYYAGRLVDWKGVAFAIDALRHGEADGWMLHIFGDGPARRRLERRALGAGVAERVVFHGHRPRDQVLAFARERADCFVFPSLHDSGGWAVAEAASLGLPVVCFDIGGPPVLAGGNATPIARNVRKPARAIAEALAQLPDAVPRQYPEGDLDSALALALSPSPSTETRARNA